MSFFTPFSFIKQEIAAVPPPPPPASSGSIVFSQNPSGLAKRIVQTDFNGDLIRYIPLVSAQANNFAFVNTSSYVIAGAFTTVDGVSRRGVAKISNGAIDTTGGWGGAGFSGSLTGNAVYAQNDGKFIVRTNGTVTGSYNGTNITGTSIFRLDSNGDIDTSWPISGSTLSIGTKCIAIDKDDNLYLGNSTSDVIVNGTNYGRTIVKFDVDGNYVWTSNSITPTGSALTLSTIPSGSGDKLVVSGDFNTYGTSSVARGIMILNTSDGSIDSSFNAGAGIAGVTGIAVCVGKYLPKISKIALLGSTNTGSGFQITSYSGSSVKNFAIINIDGTLDTNYEPAYNPASGTSWSTAAQNNSFIEANVSGTLFVPLNTRWNGIASNVAASQSLLVFDSTGSRPASFNYNTFQTASSLFGSIVSTLILEE